MTTEYIPNKNLTLKQRKFVEGYVEHGNGSKAAVDAGYSENTKGEIAYENLKKPQIAQELTRIQDIMAARVGISVEKTLGIWKQWSEQGDNPAASLKASEFIAKYLKMFDDEKTNVFEHEKLLKQLEKLEKKDD